MEGRNLFQIVKDFLLSNMNKQLLVFLFFVLLSAVFWFILTLNGAYEKELKIPVQIVNVPRNVMSSMASTTTASRLTSETTTKKMAKALFPHQT